jgi:hypothetical protein
MKHMHDRAYKTGHIYADAQRCLCAAFKTTAYLGLHATTITKITEAMSVSTKFLSYKGTEYACQLALMLGFSPSTFEPGGRFHEPSYNL